MVIKFRREHPVVLINSGLSDSSKDYKKHVVSQSTPTIADGSISAVLTAARTTLLQARLMSSADCPK